MPQPRHLLVECIIETIAMAEAGHIHCDIRNHRIQTTQYVQ